MNILQKIIQHKLKEVEFRKSIHPVKLLERSIYFNAPVISLKKYLQREDKVGIIAEIKRKSPSKGMINKYVDIERTSIGYMQAGASALSVLTDEEFFGGKNEDLITARKFNYCPILRKDFTVDEYQIIEARSIGADAILLLACVLSPEQIKNFTATAHQLGLEVLLELRDKEELVSYNSAIDVVGVNNRNLETMEISLERSLQFAALLPNEAIKVSESGISSADDLLLLKEKGYNGFLMGESFMKHSRPEEACAQLIRLVEEKSKTILNIRS
jgi:indole-3-glycerol phosphate synthase